MKKSLALLSLFGAFSAMAQVSPMEYSNYTPINANEAKDVWNSMKTGFKKNAECFNRAVSWTYDIKKQFGFEGKRIYIHFSYLYNKELSSGWGYHTAPVYNVDGEDLVFDKGFGNWVHTPLTEQMWEDRFVQYAQDKLVEKRIKLDSKIKEAKASLRSMSRSDVGYDSKLQTIQKYNDELKNLKITDEDLLNQRPLKIAKIERWLNFINEEMSKNRNNPGVLNQLKFDLKYYEDQLRMVKKDLNYAALVSCERITHIEELDYNKDGAWCFIQEASIYYWNVPQLRNLNYGPGYSLTKVPLVSELPQKYIEGEKYIKTEFDMNEVWAARNQAFGSDASKLWETEYKLKEDSAKAVKNIYYIVKSKNKNMYSIQKSMESARKNINKYRSLSRYQETLLKIEDDSNKNSEIIEKAQEKIVSLASDISVEGTRAKVEAYRQAERAGQVLDALVDKAKDLDKTISKLAKDL